MSSMLVSRTSTWSAAPAATRPIGSPEHHPQDVGAVGQDARSRPIADRRQAQRRGRAERVDHRGEEDGAGGGGQLALPLRDHGEPAQQRRGGRRRDGHQPVGGAHHSCPHHRR